MHPGLSQPVAPISAWFAGPKAENGDWFAGIVGRIITDYHAWRRNYYAEDGVAVDSAARREAEPFRDRFEDRLIELLARLKQDVPFQSPRYAAHMVAEQTLPSIAGYLAALLYNPNNVSADAAPVTVRLELEAAAMIARMLGHTDGGWAHLTGGGTIANLEALWVARTVSYLPLAIAEARSTLGLAEAFDWKDAGERLRRVARPANETLADYAQLFHDAASAQGGRADAVSRVYDAIQGSRFNPAQRGMAEVEGAVGSSPVLLVPETHHYCFDKAADVIGIGRDALVRVRVDGDFRMRPDDLEARLDDVQAQGRHVLGVVTVVGTTEEGAVDPVDQIVALRAKREASGRGSFWLHADAAYGGYLKTLTIPRRSGLGPPSARVQLGGVTQDTALQLPHGHACDALERLGECDSITIDPHKLGYVPYPAGCVSFRSSLVKPLVRQHAPYLEEPAEAPEEERRSESIGVYALEGSKPGAAAAGVWLSHTLIPLNTDGHGALVRQTIRSACELYALLEQYPQLAGGAAPVRAICLCPPGSNIVCYVFVPSDGCSLSLMNAVNAAVYRRFGVRLGQRVTDQAFFVSRTTLSATRYAPEAVSVFLARLGASHEDYQSDGVFLLRSVLMNPWYDRAKEHGRYFLSELVTELYRAAAEEFTIAAGHVRSGSTRPLTSCVRADRRTDKEPTRV